MAPGTPVQKHHFGAYLTIGGIQLPGSFDKFEGGGITLDVSSYRPGGMVGTIIMPSPKQITNITLERYCDEKRDMPLLPWIEQRIETDPVAVTLNTFDAQKKPLRTKVYNGRVTEYSDPDFDSTDDSGDPPVLSFEIMVEVPA